jgi:hypothetical protein
MSSIDHTSFMIDCRRGRLSTLKAASHVIDVDQMAYYATFAGHLHILKWLLHCCSTKALTEDALICYALERMHVLKWFLRVEPDCVYKLYITYGPEKSRAQLVEEYLNFWNWTSHEEAEREVAEQLDYKNSINQNKIEGVKFARKRALQLISFFI